MRATRLRYMLALGVACASGSWVSVPQAQAVTQHWPKPPASWMNSDFAKCVRMRESGNGRASHNLYGMMAGWKAAGGQGDAWHASYAEQHYRAYRLWLRYGVSPWRPYDGC